MRVNRASSVTVDTGSPENGDVAGTREPLVGIGHVNGSVKYRGGVDVGVKAGGVSNQKGNRAFGAAAFEAGATELGGCPEVFNTVVKCFAK